MTVLTNSRSQSYQSDDSPLSSYLLGVASEGALSKVISPLWFVGLDLAPNEKLETGLVILDGERCIHQADKIITDAQIVTAITQLAAPGQVVIAIDAPKSLSLETKWQQERVRMHPLQLKEHSNDGAALIGQPALQLDRFSERLWFVADELIQRGYTVVVTVDAIARQRYGLNIPFRARTPQGCRAMQAAIKKELRLQGVPSQMVPTSVLDAMITAFTAWLVANGKRGEQFELYADTAQRLFAEPL
jgi:predicted nuclease with RNAse H fold